MDIGKKIKNRRRELGLTQRELADKMGYSNQTTITKIESGSVDVPQSKIIKFAEVLNVSIAYLMDWEINLEDKTYILHDFMMDIKNMELSFSELQNIKNFAKIVKETENNISFQKILLDMFFNIYKLNLSENDLSELYTYAQFLKSKSK